MDCPLNRLFKSIILAIAISLMPLALVAGTRDDLYTEGLAAYDNSDYVGALKKLYAFYIINETDIEKNPEFKNKLMERISASEAILRLTFASNRSVYTAEKGIRIETGVGGSFIGNGIEIQDFIENKGIDLKKMQALNHRALAMPSEMVIQ